MGIYVMTTAVAFQSAINSGNYSLLSPALQTNLGRLYTRFDAYNNYTSLIHNWRISTTSALSGSRNGLLEIIEHRKTLRSDLVSNGMTKMVSQLETEKADLTRRVPSKWWG